MIHFKRTKVIWPTKKHTHTVIFLTERGESPEDAGERLWSAKDSNDKNLMQNFPSFAWVFMGPIPTSRARNPVARFVRQWFDVWDDDDYDKRDDVKVAGILRFSSALQTFIVKTAEQLEWKWENIILAGFSQGGAMMLHTFLNFQPNDRRIPIDARPNHPKFGAVLIYGCRLPFLGKSVGQMRNQLRMPAMTGDDAVIRNGLVRETPILLQHNEEDKVHNIKYAKQLRDQLRSWGCRVTWKSYIGGHYRFNRPRGIKDIVIFLPRALKLETTSDDGN